MEIIPFEELVWPLEVLIRCGCNRTDQVTFRSMDHIIELIKRNHRRLKSEGYEEPPQKGLITIIHRASVGESIGDGNFTHRIDYSFWFDEKKESFKISGYLSAALIECNGHKEPPLSMTEMELLEKVSPGSSEYATMIKKVRY